MKKPTKIEDLRQEHMLNQEEDATLELLEDKSRATDLAVWLGSVALSCLQSDGIVTFFIKDKREDTSLPANERKRNIHLAAVTHVHLFPEALEVTPGDQKIARYIRPILTSGRPSIVARKDGVLWEVELEDKRE